MPASSLLVGDDAASTRSSRRARSPRTWRRAWPAPAPRPCNAPCGPAAGPRPRAGNPRARVPCTRRCAASSLPDSFAAIARVGAIQRFALREIGPVVRQQRQAGVVAGAQLVGIEHAVQVADGRPGARQPVRELFQRQHRVGERGMRLRLQRRRPHRGCAASSSRMVGSISVARDAVEGGERGPANVCVGHFVPRTARTGSVSGRTPRHRVNDSAACSTSMPQPLWARAQPCSMDQLTKGVACLAVAHVVADGVAGNNRAVRRSAPRR